VGAKPDTVIFAFADSHLGAFDVLAEFWPNLAIIIYRVKQNNHYLLANIFLATSIITVMGTTAETVMIFVFLGSVWHKLSLDFKVATPILHCIFMAAQIHGSRVLFALYKSQKRKLREIDGVEEANLEPKGKEMVEDAPVVPKHEQPSVG
jgi:O-antigen/teichoic acid export membrane protein